MLWSPGRGIACERTISHIADLELFPEKVTTSEIRSASSLPPSPPHHIKILDPWGIPAVPVDAIEPSHFLWRFGEAGMIGGRDCYPRRAKVSLATEQSRITFWRPTDREPSRWIWLVSI